MQSKIRRKPGSQNVAVRRSIRPEPVGKLTEAEMQQAEARKSDQEMWGGVTGIVIFAAAIAVVIVGIGAASLFYYNPAAAANEARFRQCYNGGINCVLDGDSIYFQREKVEIAGIETPAIQGSKCEAERNRGIDAAVRLAVLLNSGEVSVSDAFRDQYGRVVRHALVNGKDVGKKMISARVARNYIGEKRDWCARAGEGGGRVFFFFSFSGRQAASRQARAVIIGVILAAAVMAQAADTPAA